MFNINKDKRVKIKFLIDKLLKKYTIVEMENILITNFLKINNITNINESYLTFEFKYTEIPDVDINIIDTLESLEYAFELLIDEDEKNKNGIVFTPFYIVEEIIDELLKNEKFNTIINKKIIDPSCGCGTFLRGALIKIKYISGLSYKEIIENCIYGIDIKKENIKRAKIILTLQCVLEKENYENIKFKLYSKNSLKESLTDICNVKERFDYIIGNPPYGNSHDLNKETQKMIKESFKTTKKGTTNIFYAFIEHSMSSLSFEGELGFIVPNNFLKIKAAENLRSFLTDNKYIKKIIDFKDNMIFDPVRTYNCIIYLNHKINEGDKFQYSIIEKTNNIYLRLKEKTFTTMDIKKLDYNGWNLLSDEKLNNIAKIEDAGIKIKKLIKTGIATLKDEVYILDGYDNKIDMYYKIFNGDKFIIETSLVKKLYKISDVDKSKNISEAEKYIIFPYYKMDDKYKVIEEEKLKKYKNTYYYLLNRKNDLGTRSSSKDKKLKWYEYGRSQGLNKYGKKLFYPTFSDKPKFILMEDEDTLFCNGYAIFDSDILPLKVLQKILNSNIMKYYINNTSYSIDGGYFCYQKKYIENFSIPNFTKDELIYLNNTENVFDINKFLTKKYNIYF